MEASILNGTKKALGIESSYTQFDPEIIMHINSAFSTLHTLGIGPVQGFAIEDEDDTWDAFLSGDNRFNSAKQYVYYKVKLAFDPPNTSFVIASMEKAIAEIEWRLNIVREGVVYGVPVGSLPDTGTPPPTTDPIYDGGGPDSSSDGPIYDGGGPGGADDVPVDDTVYDGGTPGSSSDGTVYDGGGPTGETDTSSGTVYDGGGPSGSSSGTVISAPTSGDTIYDGGTP